MINQTEIPQSIPIKTPEGEEFNHLLDSSARDAIYGAIAANRPLLVRGEPGLGKSQLALAASAMLNRPYKSFTIDLHTEARDLLYSFDAVRRLAEAQVAAQLYKTADEIRTSIDVTRFVNPGPLWWAINWKSANEQHKLFRQTQDDEIPVFANPNTPTPSWNKRGGMVILIDEIDKADPSLPNGLLEVLGSHQFTPIGFPHSILRDIDSTPPLIVITTNRERAMPSAFLRRCVVLDLELPNYENLIHEEDSTSSNEKEKKGYNPFIEYFVMLGNAHFQSTMPEDIYREVAEILYEDRKNAKISQTGTIPGPAEYIDLLRAMVDWTEWKTNTGSLQAADSIAHYKQLCVRLKRYFFTNKYHEF
jgi:MoxR-like ATPase